VQLKSDIDLLSSGWSGSPRRNGRCGWSQSGSALLTKVSIEWIYGLTGGAAIFDPDAAVHAEQRVYGIIVIALDAQHELARQLVE
jgi:hypothetical protein